MEPATIDRIQRMIDGEATERFPADVVPRLALLRYGDHPVIEPGELYLRVILGQDGAARDAWMEEHGDRLEDFRAQRLPEVKGFVVTTDIPDSAGRRPTGIMKMDGISLLAPEDDEIARGFTPIMAQLGPADTETLDALITAGIAASRSESVRWALARVREQPAYAELSERAREHGAVKARAGMDRTGMDRAVQNRRQTELDEQVKERFPDGEVQRVALLQYGDDPWVEPGDLLVRVFIEEAEEDPPLPAWERDHEATCRELHRELAEKVPGVRYLEFWFGGDTGHQGRTRQRLSCPPAGPAGRERDLTPVDVRLGSVDLEMLDTLITAGTAASRAEAIGWILPASANGRPTRSSASGHENWTSSKPGSDGLRANPRTGNDTAGKSRWVAASALHVQLADRIGWHAHRFQQREEFVPFRSSHRRIVRRQRRCQLDRQLPVLTAAVHQLNDLQGAGRDAIGKPAGKARRSSCDLVLVHQVSSGFFMTPEPPGFGQPVQIRPSPVITTTISTSSRVPRAIQRSFHFWWPGS